MVRLLCSVDSDMSSPFVFSNLSKNKVFILSGEPVPMLQPASKIEGELVVL